MAFVIPDFPLEVNIYTAGTYGVDPPRVTTVGNLAHGRRLTTEFTLSVPEAAGLLFIGPSVLLLPKLTDVRGLETGPETPDVIECPAGSARTYICLRVDDYGKGFSNEHRFAVMTPYPELYLWPTPIP